MTWDLWMIWLFNQLQRFCQKKSLSLALLSSARLASYSLVYSLSKIRSSSDADRSLVFFFNYHYYPVFLKSLTGLVSFPKTIIDLWQVRSKTAFANLTQLLTHLPSQYPSWYPNVLGGSPHPPSHGWWRSAVFFFKKKKKNISYRSG